MMIQQAKTGAHANNVIMCCAKLTFTSISLRELAFQFQHYRTLSLLEQPECHSNVLNKMS